MRLALFLLYEAPRCCGSWSSPTQLSVQMLADGFLMAFDNHINILSAVMFKNVIQSPFVPNRMNHRHIKVRITIHDDKISRRRGGLTICKISRQRFTSSGKGDLNNTHGGSISSITSSMRIPDGYIFLSYFMKARS
jgi:hypothetical protein